MIWNAVKLVWRHYIWRLLTPCWMVSNPASVSYGLSATRTTQKVIITHWGRVMQISVSNLTIIVSDNGLSPGRRQAIIWTNAGKLLIWPLGTNVSEILIEILTFSFKKMHWKVSSVKRRPFCLGLNVIMSKWVRQQHKTTGGRPPEFNRTQLYLLRDIP